MNFEHLIILIGLALIATSRLIVHLERKRSTELQPAADAFAAEIASFTTMTRSVIGVRKTQ